MTIMADTQKMLPDRIVRLFDSKVTVLSDSVRYFLNIWPLRLFKVISYLERIELARRSN